MKRLIALLLCLCMVFALTACGNDSKEPSKPQDKPSATEPAPDDSTPTDGENDVTEPSEGSDVTEDTIRENGQLPESAKDLTRAEKKYYIGKVMQAIIDLDVETMNEYASDNSAYMIRSVKEDDVYRAMWEKSIGQSLYMEDSHMLIYKDPDYICGAWMTELGKTGGTMKANIDDYTEEEIVAVFEKYYEKAPYIAVKVDIEDDFDIDIEDGKIVIDCNDCLASTAWDELADVCVPHPISRSAEELAQLAFGSHAGNMSLGLDYIKNEGFTMWEAYITGDLGSIVAALDSTEHYDMNIEITDTTNQLMEMVYQHFYKDAERVAKIQAWMDENVLIVRDVSSVHIYAAAETEETYPYYELTDAEKAELDGLKIYVKNSVHKHEANTDNEFYPFYEVVAQMARLGAIEWMSEGGPA